MYTGLHFREVKKFGGHSGLACTLGRLKNLVDIVDATFFLDVDFFFQNFSRFFKIFYENSRNHVHRLAH
jgi:hypothetical protein